MEPIALQMYTVRGPAGEDFLGTLRKVAEMGYPAVEFAGYGGLGAKELRKEMDALGIKTAGAHVGYALWDQQLEQTIQDLQTLGATHATVPWLAPEMRPTTADQAKALAETFGRWGAAAKAAGIRLGYHNHDFEFVKADGQYIFDVIANAVDPSTLDMQLDAYWAQRAGADPLAIIQRYPNRIPQLHVKDLAASGTRDAIFGEGIIDWDHVLPAAAKNGTHWYIVEQDTPDDPLKDVAASLKNLRGKLASLKIA
jgi:sugar phosphate isomerase/epimerase